jgi:hypothetical protein
LGRDDKHASLGPDDEDDDGESHAADEPTAVWDESALRAAGLEDLLKRREVEPAARPATPANAGRDASIVIDEAVTSPPSGPPVAVRAKLVSQPARSAGFGWPATIAIAIALGVAAYVAIRFLRG